MADGQTEILVNQQGKDEYIEFLKTFICVPEVIQETNMVTLKERFDTSKGRNQNVEKKANKKFILEILGISLAIAVFLYIPSLIGTIYVNKHATTEDLLRAEEYLKANYQNSVIQSSDKSAKKLSDGDIVVTYRFHVTMKTPESDSDDVSIFMSNSGNSPYYITSDDIEWSITIRQNKEDGKKWDYLFQEHEL